MALPPAASYISGPLQLIYSTTKFLSQLPYNMQTRTVPERSSSDLQQTVSRCSDATDRRDHEKTQDVGETHLGLGEAQKEEVV